MTNDLQSRYSDQLSYFPVLPKCINKRPARIYTPANIPFTLSYDNRGIPIIASTGFTTRWNWHPVYWLHMVGFEPTFSPGEGWSFIQLNYMATILKNFYSRKGPVYVRQRAPHFVFPNLQQLLPHNCIYPLTRAVSLTGTRPTAVTYLLPEELTTALLWYYRRPREQSLPVRAVERTFKVPFAWKRPGH